MTRLGAPPAAHEDLAAVRGADLAVARQALAEAARRADDMLAVLPEPGQRSPEQRAAAAAAKDSARALHVRPCRCGL